MRMVSKTILLFICICVLIGQSQSASALIMKEFTPAGRIEALIENAEGNDFLLIQLDLKNDSLFHLVDTVLPDMELLSGPASYHRIVAPHHFAKVQEVLSSEFYSILDENYSRVTASREYWVDFKQGGETQGTWSDDDAIEYTCSCLSGASDCVKLGWDESWWNPLDYWGEAWYGYQPPYYESIQEIRVTVRGGQCDDLPLWSETYMGMMDNNGNWSEDYELSINYTDNEFIVGSTWNGSMLMPRIGSEDNYCIDTIKLEFFYTCNDPDSPTNLLASDEEECSTVNLTWSLPPSAITQQVLYRDDTIIAQLNGEETNYEDWGAQAGVEHIYCIEAVNACGSSAWTCNPGSVKIAPIAPSNVYASDGAYSDEVLITWDGVNSADDYRIYRDGSWMGIVSAEYLEYIDVIPELDVFYEYCVESVNDCGESDWECDTGYVASPLGDVNADGSINVLDIVVVVNIIIETYVPNDEELIASDMNSDTSIDVLDIVILVNIILEG